MKILSIMTCLIGGTFISVFAQDPNESQQKAQQDQINAENRQREQKVNQEFEKLKQINGRKNINNSFPKRIIRSRPPVPKLSKEQAARLQPEPEDAAKFETFLKTPKTGLIKLFPALDCGSKYVVSADEACQNLIPRSSFYSFREAKYSIRELSDIRLKNNTFMSDGLLSSGIIVWLGDIPIQTISTTSDGMKFLSDFTPATQIGEAFNISNKLEKGIKDSDYNYAWSAPVKENTTYGIRVIAYRGKLMTLNGPFYYDALGGDERADIIAVFRVVRKNNDGSLTLLWKELQRKTAPEIKVSKEEQKKQTVKPL
jgi:hypothetical protein